MRKTIILGNIENNKVLRSFESQRTFFYTENLREAFQYHLDNLEIDSYILDSSSFTLDKLIRLTEQIQFLNSLISVLIYKPDSESLLETDKEANIHILNNDEEFELFFNTIEKNSRSFNRVQWPLQVIFHEEGNRSRKFYGIVLSLSVGGCFIKLDEQVDKFEERNLILTFYFKDFNFLVEGRLNRKEILENGQISALALEFVKISPMTTSYLKEIIDNEILSELMDIVQ